MLLDQMAVLLLRHNTLIALVLFASLLNSVQMLSVRDIIIRLQDFNTNIKEPENNTNNTISSIESEQKCESLLTQTAYSLDLCDAADAESYMKYHKSQFTCENRCDQMPRYLDVTTRDCACDERCVVYRDCCLDIAKVCSDTHRRGEETYSHLKGAHSACIRTFYSVISSRRTPDSVSPTQTPATTSPMSSTSFTTQGSINSSYFPGVLSDYLASYNHFRVADTTFGVIFESYNAFHSWRVPTSVASFIPKAITLKYIGQDVKSLKKSKMSEMFKSSMVSSSYDVPSDMYRSCPIQEIIACVCGDQDEIIGNFRHDSCQGKYNEMTLFKRHAIFKTHEIHIEHNMAIKNCIFRTYYGHFKMFELSTGNKQSIQITMQPVILSQGKGVLGETDELEIEHVGVEEGIGGDRIEYIFESSLGIERRVLCPSLDVFPSQCRPVQCSQGAVLALSSTISAQLGHPYYCMVSGAAVILGPGFDQQISVCACLRAVLALSTIWDVTNLEPRKQCFFNLEMNPDSKWFDFLLL